jgi:hypothetical protein
MRELLDFISNPRFFGFRHGLRFVPIDQHGWIGPPAIFNGLGGEEPNMEDEDIDAEAEKIVRESLEMGDKGITDPPEGQTCARCGRDAIRQEPETDEWLCDKHSKERFQERHG